MSTWEVALVGVTCLLGGFVFGFLTCAILSIAKKSDEQAERMWRNGNPALVDELHAKHIDTRA